MAGKHFVYACANSGAEFRETERYRKTIKTANVKSIYYDKRTLFLRM